MKYDFDKIIDRSGTNALKYSVLKERYGRDDLIPLWVADLDFETPDFITDALRKRLEHSLFGYTATPDELWNTIARWIEDHHGWKVNKEWITFIPGVMKGVGSVVNVFVKPDEKVIIQPPVYFPFRLTPQGNEREVVFNPLKRVEGGSYEIDFENLAAVADDKCRLLILSNPHNPAGICWSRETLARLADFCYERNIIVISDEIHCDLTLFGNRHIPFASVSDKAAQISITFGAPSKTFNTAGIVNSYTIVPNDTLRRRFFKWLEANEFNEPPIFSTIAIIAAFQKGEEWRRQLISYIEDNVRFVQDYFKEHIPSIKPLRPQATFLVWLDCRELGLDHNGLIDLFVNKARLALNDGETFGPGGEGFMRLNVGAPRAILEAALERLAVAVEDYSTK
ncbi:MAG: PatB family C-S lyase [Bacteroidaceae bacterium]|nr:PatB family C-S lyase [Bacteroidaceae bacterium]MBR6856070.1 PatB family C-S lyase [Bacteroidaceae bacterium]